MARTRHVLEAVVTENRVRPLPPGMPAFLSPLHQRIAAIVERLPSTPPSFAAAQVLNRVLMPKLPPDARAALNDRVVELEVTDLAWRFRLRYGIAGFAAAGDRAEAALRIAATSTGWLRLVRGADDPDRLFFDRVLVMEGDTELGLVLKNTLDAIGPLWPKRRA
jgi:predicted lipid carrier protein YhbT